jgi:hypothetical protein
MEVHGFHGMSRAARPHRSHADVRKAADTRAAQTETRRLAAQAAVADYDAARRAVALNAERLRALRLARDAAQAEQLRAKPKKRPRPN